MQKSQTNQSALAQFRRFLGRVYRLLYYIVSGSDIPYKRLKAAVSRWLPETRAQLRKDLAQTRNQLSYANQQLEELSNRILQLEGQAAEISIQGETEKLSEDVIYRPIFYFDGLWTDPKVIHNHDFMRDPRYVEAYLAGHRSLQHDHKMFWRLHVALYFAQRGLALEGDFVECGVWRGFLTSAIAKYVDWKSIPKNFYLFDTFDGLVEELLTENERANTQKLEHLNSHFVNSYEHAKKNFAEYDNIHLIRGVVPKTLPQAPLENVAYLSLDMNCTKPEIAAAEFFWDKMVPSAAIVLDDYGMVSYEDQKVAFDKFAEERGVEVLHMPSGQGIIMKP